MKIEESKEEDKKLVAKRVSDMLKALEETPQTLSDKLGYERPDNIYNAIKAKTYPGLTFLSDFSNKFENINIGWILTGKGQMFLDGEKKDFSASVPAKEDFQTKYIALLEKSLQEKDNQVNNLQEELKKVRESLEIVLKNQSTMDATIQAALEEMVRQVAKEQSPVWLDNIYNVAAVIELENRKKDNRLQIGIQRNS